MAWVGVAQDAAQPQYAMACWPCQCGTMRAFKGVASEDLDVAVADGEAGGRRGRPLAPTLKGQSLKRFIPLLALALTLLAPNAVSAQTSQFAVPQYNGQTSIDCVPSPSDNTRYPCAYPDGSFVWWLLGTADWAVLTYRNGPCRPDQCEIHVTPDGAAYFKSHPGSGMSAAPGDVLDTTPMAHAPISVPPEGSPAITPVGVPASIPAEFCGQWLHRGDAIMIDCSGIVKELSPIDNLPKIANATGMTMVGVWCSSLPNPNVGLCDRQDSNGNVTWGMHETYWVEPSADTPGQLNATIVSTLRGMLKPNDSTNYRGRTEFLTIADGPMLAVDGQPRYCNEATDPDSASMWCAI
jgi:hypothetical protein